jgi:excisionase family DNA binding protein
MTTIPNAPPGSQSSISPWLTAEEAAAYTKTSKKTLYSEVRRNRLRAARIGGRRELRFRREFLDAWLQASVEPIEV